MDDSDPVPLGGVPLGDVTALANAMARSLGRPVAVLDQQWGVLGYSSLDHGGDRLQRDAILRQQVPKEQARHETRRALFTDDSAQRFSTGGSYAEPGAPTSRVGAGIRHGTEPLGMVWVLEGHTPLGDAQLNRIAAFARAAAPHLLRLRELRLDARARQGALVADALEPGPGAPVAVRKLGLDVAAGLVVIAIAPAESPAGPAELDAIATALAVYRPSAVCALLDGVVVVIAAPGAPFDWVGDLLRAAEPTALAGIGSVVTAVAGLARSAVDAGLVLRTLRADGTTSPGWAPVAQAWAPAALLELSELLVDHPDLLANRVVPRMDERTVLAWIEHHGDIRGAATELGVHPNTVRYRIRRMAESGVDLDDPAARLIVWLTLRSGLTAAKGR